MKWIGKEEAKAAAEKGEQTALDCSIEHWWQLSHRPKSVLNALEKLLTGICSDECALCQYWRDYDIYNYCECCPAGSGLSCCDSLYYKAKDARPIWQKDVPKFTKASLKVWKFLKNLK